jgi:hypothetical protein
MSASRIAETLVDGLVADTIERALPTLGRQGSADVLAAATALAGGFWQATHPPRSPTIDFQSTLTRLLTATCVGLTTDSE